MDSDTEKHYRKLLKEWKKDEDNIKDQLDEMEGIDEYLIILFLLWTNLIEWKVLTNKSFEV